jgi:hypothetical protein
MRSVELIILGVQVSSFSSHPLSISVGTAAALNVAQEIRKCG